MFESKDFNQEVQLESKSIQLKLAKGEITYDSDEVQFFIPVIVTEQCLEWLNLIAENTLVAEDEEIVKNFLAKAHSIRDVNKEALHQRVTDKLGEL